MVLLLKGPLLQMRGYTEVGHVVAGGKKRKTQAVVPR
jgi:hypothetical protein